MIIEYIIFGVLVLIAIVITPLSIRARRKTLREIDSLRVSLKHDVKVLTDKVELRIGKTVSTVGKQRDSIANYDLDNKLDNLWEAQDFRNLDFGLNLSVEERKKAIYACTTEELWKDYQGKYRYTKVPPLRIWVEHSPTDAWDDYKARGRAMLTASAKREVAISPSLTS